MTKVTITAVLAEGKHVAIDTIDADGENESHVLTPDAPSIELELGDDGVVINGMEEVDADEAAELDPDTAADDEEETAAA